MSVGGEMAPMEKCANGGEENVLPERCDDRNKQRRLLSAYHQGLLFYLLS